MDERSISGRSDEIDALEDFWAKFKPEDFAEVAHALGLPSEEPEILSCLRDHLVPEFRFFVESCSGSRVPREDRIDRLEKLQKATVGLYTNLGPGGAIIDLPRRWFLQLADGQLRKKLHGLARDAETQIGRLRSLPRGRAGRPSYACFRQLGYDLVRVFKRIEAPVRDLDFGDFYRFATAACACLRMRIPAVNRDMPRQERVREHLREIWSCHDKNGKSTPSRTNKPA